ncbi:MAG: LysE family transporter [Saprospiraceae bacterium]
MLPSHLLSLVLFGEGFLTGITLTAMIGPVTMVILHYGIQVNRVAGVWAATGTWISDLIFIVFTFWTTASLAEWIEQESIRLWIYILGGCALLFFGGLMAMSRKPPVKENVRYTGSSYAKAFFSGFFVNSFSPFTLFFWVGAAVFLHLQNDKPVWYYIGVMLSLAIGDFAKAWAAPILTRWIREKYITLVQVIAGVVIAMTGLYIIGMGIFGYE